MSRSHIGPAAIPIRSLLQSASDEDLRDFISVPVRELLASADPEALAGQRLRDLLDSLWSPPELIRDASLRGHLIRLLTPDRAQQLAALLGLPADSNATESLITADLAGRRAQGTLARFFGIPESSRYASGATNVQGTVVASHGLFEYQRALVHDLMSGLQQPPRRVVLHLPTGAGKTRIAMSVIAESLRSRNAAVVLWLAYSRELLEQAATAFEISWQSLGDRDATIVRYWGDADLDLATVTDGLVVAGLGKLDALAGRDYQAIARLADRTVLTIMDEAHQSIARTYRQLLELFATKRPDAGLLGLTATPGRTWADIDQDAELAAFYRFKKVMLRTKDYDNPIEYLIDRGYLARPNFVNLNTKAGLSLSDADRRSLASSLDIPSDILKRLADDEQRSLRILDAIENLLGNHRRVIAFATTAEHARLLAAILRSRGHSAEAITAATPWLDRERAIQRYRMNTAAPMVLCNYGVLTTGFDAPSTSAAIIARPTRSLVLYSQMVGRAIRGPKAGGNQSAEIVTVIDLELPGFSDIAEAFTNWEDVWSSTE